ncbi:hypothetical protein J4210_05065 [Candidatus Woesearchaeota archaeon]|nr:hypothetical protein [Candidatus Woesearchaeota archaeon]
MREDKENKVPLEVLLDGRNAIVGIDYVGGQPQVELRDKLSIDLSQYDLQRMEGESPLAYVTRVRELFVKYTPNADPTPETLR